MRANALRARYGSEAVEVGSADFDRNDAQTNAVDTITNVLHYAQREGGAPRVILELAWTHFRQESREYPDPPEKIADAWRRYKAGEDVDIGELRAIDEWRADVREDWRLQQ